MKTGAHLGNGHFEFSALHRAAILAEIAREPLDLLVIGGGINGAGIARDAALRGLRVGLVDKGDFAGGTSSRSSKLIHGGLRYLELGDLRLVFTACQERDLLRRRLAPHLVRPLAFLFPVYAGDPRGLLAITAGLWLYDLLATFRNIARHKRLSRRATLEQEPLLRATDLRGAGLYYDCWTDDARLTIETIMAARAEGALACNYASVVRFDHVEGRLVGAQLCDVLTQQAVTARARVVVNAAGPWADALRTLDDPDARPVLRLTKGTHIVLPRARVGNRHAVVLRAPRDGRVMFVIPWDELTLVGTTDTDYDGSADGVRPDRDDVDYLLEAVNRYFPASRLTVEDIVSAFAGLRPLVAPSPELNAGPSGVSREEEILVSPSGLITLAGGKITTYRRVAVAVVDRVVEELRRQGDPRRFPKSSSHRKPLEGVDGSGAPDGGSLQEEIRTAATAEMAVHIEDVLRRRLDLTLKDASQGMEVLSEVVRVMGDILGWDPARRRAEEAAYRTRITEDRRGWTRS